MTLLQCWSSSTVWRPLHELVHTSIHIYYIAFQALGEFQLVERLTKKSQAQ